MNIEVKSTSFKNIIKLFADTFNTEFEEICDEYRLKIPEKFGSGTVRGINFHHGIGLFMFNAVLKQDLTLKYKIEASQPVRFIFCMNGELVHIFENQSLQYILSQFEGSITAGSKDYEQVIKMPAKTRINFNSLEINRETYLPQVECDLETLPDKLAEIFRDVDAEKPFLYTSHYSISISELMKKINNYENAGLVRKAFLESLSLQLFSFQIKQYEYDLRFEGNKVLLRKYDIDKVIEAKEIILDDLKNPPNIRDLSKMVGVNQNKLKKGFKTVFNTTINNYLRSERLNKAKLLLATGEMLIEEVSEEVGYVNKSHFARRFKEKFGILPKDFAKNIRTEIHKQKGKKTSKESFKYII